MKATARNPSKLLFALIAGLVGFGACGNNSVVVGNPISTSDTNIPQLDGRTFWSISVMENDAERQLLPDTRITIRFNNQMINAGAGCNIISGPYQLDNDQLSISDIATTERGCDQELHAQDEFVEGFLQSNLNFTLSGDNLAIYSDTIRVDFVDKTVLDPDRPLQETRWRTTGFIQGEMSVAMNVDAGRESWFEIDKNWQMTGFDGCTNFSLQVEVYNETIRFETFNSEECSESTSYSEAFNDLFETGEAVLSINGPWLEFLNSQNNGVTFEAEE